MARHFTVIAIAMAAALVGLPDPERGPVPGLPRAQAQDFSILDQPFDPARFRKGELRQVQRALLMMGHYNGLLDGEWGGVSQAALTRHVRRRGVRVALNRHVLPLLEAAEAVMVKLEWREVYLRPFHAQIGYPAAMLQQTRSGDKLAAFENPERTLGLRLGRLPEARTMALHRSALNGPILDSSPYTLRRPDLMVTAIVQDGVGAAYVRSDRDGDGWVTVFIYAETGGMIDEAQLMASAYLFGPDQGWATRRNPNLERLRVLALREATTPRPTEGPPAVASLPLPPSDPPFTWEGDTTPSGPAEPVTPLPPIEDLPPVPPALDPEAADSTGTGFYISARQLITNQHVVQGCRTVTLRDGTPLRVLSMDPEMDLALLEAYRPGPGWLSLASGSKARLGQRIYVLGYPYYGLIGRSLSLTTGVVSALAGVDDDPDSFTISAPIQPGNSGGPVLNREGRVIGVAVARLSADYIADRTGTLPENINFAVQLPTLKRFLEMHGGTVGRASGARIDMDVGAPDAVQAAVVPVLCFF